MSRRTILKLFRLIAIVLPFGWSAQRIYAVDAGTKATFPAVDVETFNLATEPARVRIALKMTPYYKAPVRAKNGELQMTSIANRLQENVLRARIDRANHFYFREWHVETVPLRWEKKTQRYSVRLRIYRRYGDSANGVEESVGSLEVNGVIKGENNLYTLYGTSSAQYKDKEGFAMLDINAGIPFDQQANDAIAKKPETSKPVAKKATP